MITAIPSALPQYIHTNLHPILYRDWLHPNPIPVRCPALARALSRPSRKTRPIPVRYLYLSISNTIAALHCLVPPSAHMFAHALPRTHARAHSGTRTRARTHAHRRRRAVQDGAHIPDRYQLVLCVRIGDGVECDGLAQFLQKLLMYRLH